MNATHERICASVPRYNELQKIRADTAYAVGALKKSIRELPCLEKQLSDHQNHVKRLSRNVKKRRRSHESHRDSVVRSFIYRLARKTEHFEAKIMKKEQEYLEAIHAHGIAKHDLDAVANNYEVATNEHRELKQEYRRHRNALKDLDSLYTQIFQGPSPDFPEEDAKEEAIRDIENQLHELQSRLSTEQRTHAHLTSARHHLTSALSSVNEALGWSELDILNIGGEMADLSERSALANARHSVARCRAEWHQAQRLQPSLQGPPPIEIADGDFWGDIVFDNLFSDLRFNAKIERSHGQLMNAEISLNILIESSDDRQRSLRADQQSLEQDLVVRRTELQELRAELFQRVANEPPPYKN